MERWEAILIVKRCRNEARIIAEGVVHVDVHAPRRQRAGNRGEQRRPVGSDERQLEEAAMMLQLDLHRASRQAEGKRIMGGDFFWCVGGKIALREALEEGFD